MRVLTIGHGTRSHDELAETLLRAEAETLVDVRRYPGSRRNPQFNREAVADALGTAGIRYVHAVALGGRRSAEPGEERFACIRTAAFRSYAARMAQPEWQDGLTAALAVPRPCFMCAETDWHRCHRRLIADLLAARGHDVLHLLRPDEAEPHTLSREAEARGGKLYLCGELVA